MGMNHPIESKATLHATRNGHTHKIRVSIVNVRGYEPILSKKSMLEVNLIKMLDCDRDPRINVLKTGKDPLLEE